jgi:hypothetical protein
MPALTISLTQEEYTDLERIAEERLQDPENTAHDLLVNAIADTVAARPDRPEPRAYNRGIMAARKEAKITDEWNRTFVRMSRRV